MTQNGTARILVVDDYEDWRSQARGILKVRPEWKIIAEACDGPDAVLKAAELQPDVVLLDVGLPTLNGIEVAKVVRERCPKSRVVFLTENRDIEIRDAAMRTGAVGYVLKANATSDLVDTISVALRDHLIQASLPQPR